MCTGFFLSGILTPNNFKIKGLNISSGNKAGIKIINMVFNDRFKNAQIKKEVVIVKILVVTINATLVQIDILFFQRI